MTAFAWTLVGLAFWTAAAALCAYLWHRIRTAENDIEAGSRMVPFDDMFDADKAAVDPRVQAMRARIVARTPETGCDVAMWDLAMWQAEMDEQ